MRHVKGNAFTTQKTNVVTQSSLLVGRGWLYDPFSRTPPHHHILRHLGLKILARAARPFGRCWM